MFAGYAIDAITNGVHVPTWTSPAFQVLFDHYISGWREDSFNLRYALSIPPQEVWDAHSRAKTQLINFINRQTNAGFDMYDLTLGFALRAASYKRGDLLFHDVERLRNLAAKSGRIQVVYAGKAHPVDQEGKELIKRIFRARDALRSGIKIAYLENYDMELAKLLTAGVDVWLNAPRPPLEASGTSGMKAAINGVPSISILDGWWIEGCIEGTTGWSIDSTAQGERRPHSARRPFTLQQARTGGHPALLPQSLRLHLHDASRNRLQWFLLQDSANALAVSPEGLLFLKLMPSISKVCPQALSSEVAFGCCRKGCYCWRSFCWHCDFAAARAAIQSRLFPVEFS